MKEKNYSYDISVKGSKYKCNAVWRGNYSPNMEIRCKLYQGSPPLKYEGEMRYVSVPLKERGLTTEKINIILDEPIELKSFRMLKESYITANPPPDDYLKEITEKEIKDNILDIETTRNVFDF